MHQDFIIIIFLSNVVYIKKLMHQDYEITIVFSVQVLSIVLKSEITCIMNVFFFKEFREDC